MQATERTKSAKNMQATKNTRQRRATNHLVRPIQVYTIYKVTDGPDGEVMYVGSTTRRLGRRRLEHVMACRKPDASALFHKWLVNNINTAVFEAVYVGMDMENREKMETLYIKNLASKLNMRIPHSDIPRYIRQREYQAKFRRSEKGKLSKLNYMERAKVKATERRAMVREFVAIAKAVSAMIDMDEYVSNPSDYTDSMSDQERDRDDNICTDYSTDGENPLETTFSFALSFGTPESSLESGSDSDSDSGSDASSPL